MKLTIYGAPRSKKNSETPMRTGSICRTCRKRSGRVYIRVSPAWKKWLSDCNIEIGGEFYSNGAAIFGKKPRISWPINCRAIFYMSTRRSVDACNMYEGLADLLEHYRIVANDGFIVSWDGSRISYDKHNPRVEVELTTVAADGELSEVAT